MSIERTVRIDAELESVGQFDRLESRHGSLEVTRRADGRIRIGSALVDWHDLKAAVEQLAAAPNEQDGER